MQLNDLIFNISMKQNKQNNFKQPQFTKRSSIFKLCQLIRLV